MISLSDRLSPVFIYEIRQIVRNRMLLSALCLYLAALVGLLGYYFHEAVRLGHPENPDGKQMAVGIALLLCATGFVVSLFYSTVSTFYQGRDDELLHLTPIDWFATMCGKIQVVAVLILLFYAVTMPFLTIAWMMRGFDLLPLFFLLAVFFVLLLTFDLFMLGTVIRSRSRMEQMIANGALLVGAIPWGILWASFTAFFFGVLTDQIDLFTWEMAQSSFFFFLFIPFSTLFSSEMFKSHWNCEIPGTRFFRVALWPWLSVLLTFVFGGILMLCYLIVSSLVRLTWMALSGAP